MVAIGHYCCSQPVGSMLGPWHLNVIAAVSLLAPCWVLFGLWDAHALGREELCLYALLYRVYVMAPQVPN